MSRFGKSDSAMEITSERKKSLRKSKKRDMDSDYHPKRKNSNNKRKQKPKCPNGMPGCKGAPEPVGVNKDDLCITCYKIHVHFICRRCFCIGEDADSLYCNACNDIVKNETEAKEHEGEEYCKKHGWCRKESNGRELSEIEDEHLYECIGRPRPDPTLTSPNYDPATVGDASDTENTASWRTAAASQAPGHDHLVQNHKGQFELEINKAKPMSDSEEEDDYVPGTPEPEPDYLQVESELATPPARDPNFKYEYPGPNPWINAPQKPATAPARPDSPLTTPPVRSLTPSFDAALETEYEEAKAAEAEAKAVCDAKNAEYWKASEQKEAADAAYLRAMERSVQAKQASANKRRRDAIAGTESPVQFVAKSGESPVKRQRIE